MDPDPPKSRKICAKARRPSPNSAESLRHKVPPVGKRRELGPATLAGCPVAWGESGSVGEINPQYRERPMSHLPSVFSTEPPARRPTFQTQSDRGPAGLTARQLECLYWVQEGKSASDIGGILGISGRTVEGHLIKACGYFQVRTRFQAVLRARDLGLLTAAGPVRLPGPDA